MTLDHAAPAIAAAMAAIQRALASGGDVLAALLSPSDQRALRAAAMPRRFDRAIFDQVLAPAAGTEPAALDRLLGLGMVQPSAGRSGWYAVDDKRRTQWLDHAAGTNEAGDDLDSGGIAWKALHQRLADAFARLGPDGELEQLYHALSLHNAAEERWRSLFAAAAERFDLARCESLLDVLAQRARYVSPELASLMTRERGLLGARAAFADDYFRTSRYLERRQVLAAFEAVLADPERFILQLHAPGGSGKTMFLCWLAARWCLPRGIPIARVDFDFLDDSERALAPVFLLGKMAERLDPQLPGAPFFELLRDVAEERRRCLGRALTAGQDGDSAPPDLAALAQEVRERLARTLVERCPGRPVVLVFDTLEEATLKHQVNVLDVIEAIAAVRRRMLELAGAGAGTAPRLVLILAGRYSLAEQYPLVLQKFADQVLTCEVSRFDDGESRAYLQRRLTGITSAPAPGLVDAVVQRAHGSPFKLSLYADILLTTPALDIAELGQGVDVDMLYLIERVLKRIPDVRLRWLLRYGVLARRLTRSFVENVLLRAMRRALRGDNSADNPADDGVAHKDWARLWGSGGGTKTQAPRIDAAALWRQLRDYASASSWVSVDPTVTDAVVIQPVVSQPMRRALLHRDRPVVEQIHHAAMAFARRGETGRSDAGHLAEHLAELSYHDFQLRGAAAATAWQRRLTQYAFDDEVVEALASLLLARDLAEAEPGAAALVPPWARALALFALAELHASRARASDDATAKAKLLMQSRQHLAQFDAITLPPGQPKAASVAPARRGRLRLELAADATQTRTALLELEAALGARLDAEMRSQVLLALERGYAPLDSERARHFGRQWGRLAWRQGDAASYGESVQAELDQGLAQAAPRRAMKLLLDAQAALSPATGRWSSRSDAIGARRELAMSLPPLLDLAGLSQAALRVHEQQAATRGLDEASAQSGLLELQHAELMLAAGDPVAALRKLGPLNIHQPEGARVYQTLGLQSALALRRVRALQVQAQAARVLADHGAALDAMGQTMALQAELGDHFNEVRTRLAMARVYLFDLGNLRLAAEHLQDSEDALSGEDIELRVEHLLIRSALHDRVGNEPSSQQQLAQARALLTQVPPARWRVRLQLAVGGLALNDAATRIEQAQALAETLERIDYVGLRLGAMRELRHLRPLQALPEALADRLVQLCEVVPLALPGQQRLQPVDRIRLMMQRAEMLRVLMRPEQAVRELRALRPLLAHQYPQPWQRQLALCCDRLDMAPTEVLPSTWLAKLLSVMRRARGFCAVVQAEAADRAARANQPEHAARLLQRALQTLDQPGLLPASWQVLALASQLALASRHPDLLPDLDAKANVQRARQIGETLGLPAAAPPAPAAVVHAVLPEGAEPAAAMGLRIFEADEVTRVAYLDSGQMQERRSTPIRSPVRDMLAEFGAGRFSESASWQLVGRMGQQGSGFGQELAACALPEIIAMRLQHVQSSGLAPLALLLEHKQPGMHAMPWELLVPQLAPARPLSLNPAIKDFWRAPAMSGLRPRISWVQRVLTLLGHDKLAADGVLGPATAKALRAWQKAALLEPSGVINDATLWQLRGEWSAAQRKQGLPSTAVLLIKAARDIELSSQRGLSTGGADVASVYAQHGVTVSVIDRPDPEQLRHTLGTRPWTAIHVATPIAQSRSSRELSLQFAADYQSAHTTAFSASLLGRMLQGLPAQFAPPLVVLESPRPTSRDETIRQLLQRNAFAAQLFEYGQLHAVVAMGLAPPEVQHRYSEVLASGLVTCAEQHHPVADLVRQLRAADPERGPHGPVHDGVELLPSAGIALFARDPYIVPLPAKMS